MVDNQSKLEMSAAGPYQACGRKGEGIDGVIPITASSLLGNYHTTERNLTEAVEYFESRYACAGTTRQPVRPEDVTYVSGTFWVRK